MTPQSEEKVIAGIAEIQATLKAQNAILASHSKGIDQINHTINGNGKPGLKVTVASHDESIKFMKRLMWVTLTPIIGALGTGVVVAAVYLIRQIH